MTKKKLALTTAVLDNSALPVCGGRGGGGAAEIIIFALCLSVSA